MKRATSRRGRTGPEYRVRVSFGVPLDFAFAWCTDYTPEDASVEAVRRRNGTGLPALATTPDQMKRSGRTLARLQGCDVVASRSCGGNCAEESVRLAVRTGREEQRVDRTVVHRPMPEL